MENVICENSTDNVKEKQSNYNLAKKGLLTSKENGTVISPVKDERIEKEKKSNESISGLAGETSNSNSFTSAKLAESLSQKSLSPTLIEQAIKVMKNLFSPEKSTSKPESSVGSANQRKSLFESPSSSIYVRRKPDSSTLKHEIETPDPVQHMSVQNGVNGGNLNVNQSEVMHSSFTQDIHNNTFESYSTPVSPYDESFQSAITHLEENGEVLKNQAELVNKNSSNSRDSDFFDIGNEALDIDEYIFDKIMPNNESIVEHKVTVDALKNENKRGVKNLNMTHFMNYDKDNGKDDCIDYSGKELNLKDESSTSKLENIGLANHLVNVKFLSEGFNTQGITNPADATIINYLEYDKAQIELNMRDFFLNRECNNGVSNLLSELVNCTQESQTGVFDKNEKISNSLSDNNEIFIDHVLEDFNDDVDRNLSKSISTTTVVLNSKDSSDLENMFLSLKEGGSPTNSPSLGSLEDENQNGCSYIEIDNSKGRPHGKGRHKSYVTEIQIYSYGKNSVNGQKPKKVSKSEGNSPKKETRNKCKNLNRSIGHLNQIKSLTSEKNAKEKEEETSFANGSSKINSKGLEKSKNIQSLNTLEPEEDRVSTEIFEDNRDNENGNDCITVELGKDDEADENNSVSLVSQQSYTILSNPDLSLNRPVIADEDRISDFLQCLEPSYSFKERNGLLEGKLDDLNPDSTSEVVNVTEIPSQSTPISENPDFISVTLRHSESSGTVTFTSEADHKDIINDLYEYSEMGSEDSSIGDAKEEIDVKYLHEHSEVVISMLKPSSKPTEFENAVNNNNLSSSKSDGKEKVNSSKQVISQKEEPNATFIKSSEVVNLSRELNRTHETKSQPTLVKSLNETFDIKLESPTINKLNQSFDTDSDTKKINDLNKSLKANKSQTSPKLCKIKSDKTFVKTAEVADSKKFNVPYDKNSIRYTELNQSFENGIGNTELYTGKKTYGKNEIFMGGELNETNEKGVEEAFLPNNLVKKEKTNTSETNETVFKINGKENEIKIDKSTRSNNGSEAKTEIPDSNSSNLPFAKEATLSCGPLGLSEFVDEVVTNRSEGVYSASSDDFASARSEDNSFKDSNGSFASNASTNNSFFFEINSAIVVDNREKSVTNQEVENPADEMEEFNLNRSLKMQCENKQILNSSNFECFKMDPLDTIVEGSSEEKLPVIQKGNKSSIDPDLAQLIQQQFSTTDIEKICDLVDGMPSAGFNSQILKASEQSDKSFEEDFDKSYDPPFPVDICVNNVTIQGLDFLGSIAGSKTGRDFSKESLYVKFDPLLQPFQVNSLIDFSKEVDTVKVPSEETNIKPKSQDQFDQLLTISPQKQSDEIVPPLTPVSGKENITEEEEKFKKLKKLQNEIYFLKNLYSQRERLNKEKLDHCESRIAVLTGQNCVLEDKLKQSNERERSLVKKMNEQIKSLDELRVIMEEYMNVIQKLASEVKEIETNNKKQIDLLTAERDSYMSDLQNTEAAFTNVYTKYEKSKKTIESLKSNIVTYKITITEQAQKLEDFKDRAAKAQQNAFLEYQLVQDELNEIKASHSHETSRLRAQLRKTELKFEAVHETLHRKLKENEQLTAICDELIEGKK